MSALPPLPNGPAPSLGTREEFLLKLSGLKSELRRRVYLDDPSLWSLERMKTHLWSKQRMIIESVRDNRKTAVQSCHEMGKSFTAADVIAWWIDVHPPGEAFAVTSAPSDAQVKAILWREIGKAHARAKLSGRTNHKEWFLIGPHGKEELVAYGRKPDDLDPTSFQGIHARYVLVVFDEACGMPKALFDASDSLIANDNSRRLDIGNPDDPTSEFEKVCRPGSGWNVIKVSAFDTPNFTGEVIPGHINELLVSKTWVEEKRRVWAPNWRWNEEGNRCIPPTLPDGTEDKSFSATDPFWQSKVLGEFPPKGGPLSLIPPTWIFAAQERTLTQSEPSELGVDVGAGGDSSTAAKRNGPVVRVVHEDQNPDTMQTTGHMIYLKTTHGIEVVKVDKVGIGAGVVDRANEQGENFIGINVGLPPYVEERDLEDAQEFLQRTNKRKIRLDDPLVVKKAEEIVKKRFVNLRAQNWWFVRSLFESGMIDIDPLDKDLADQLASIRYFRTSSGQIQIESKRDAMKRGVASPNRADSVMLVMCPVPVTKKDVRKFGLVF